MPLKHYHDKVQIHVKKLKYNNKRRDKEILLEYLLNKLLLTEKE